ncbi:MAG TPA: GAF domain-containing protein [Gemmatimonadota bacterium]|nr:GAF domain-containing protein [Gemmatimonadota bacterium]
MKDTNGRPEVEGKAYEEALSGLKATLKTAGNEIDAQELVCQALYDGFDHYSWVGIYVVEGDELVLSAWAGPEETEHKRIAVGEGICGLAAETGETEVVPDVSRRAEFIACFPSTRSEIVVPIHGAGGVIGEIDIDSDWLDAFDERDRTFLEAVAARLAVVMEVSGA